MIFPEELNYTRSHEWIRFDEDGTAVIGISDYAQDALGDLVFVNLPEPGDTIEAGSAFADVESVKAVSDIFSPVTAEVSEINEDLMDSPELINEAPYEAWFVRVRDITEREEFLNAEEYRKYTESLED